MRTIRLGDIPTIKQGNKLFSLSELIGKPIIANQQTIAYKFPSEESTIYYLPDTFKTKGSEGIAIEDIDVFKNTGKGSEDDLLAPLYKVKKGKSLGIYEFSRTDQYKRYYFRDKNGVSVFIKMSEEKDKYGFRLDVFVFKGMVGKDNVYATIDKKKSLGTLDTWVNGQTMIKLSNGAYIYKKNTEIFMSFKQDNKNYYVPLKARTIDIDALEQSGAKDEETKQEEKEEDSKEWYEKLASGYFKYLKTALIIIGSGYGVYKLGTYAINKRIESKKNGN